MANLRSSQKDTRRIKRRTQQRKPFVRNARVTPKKVMKLIATGDVKAASDLMPLAFKAVDKAAKKNIIHKNKAARIKSKLAEALNAAMS
jgi:small subunit ribosomal protein S20